MYLFSFSKHHRRHTRYYGGYHSNHRVVNWLWDVLEKEFNEEEKSRFLKVFKQKSKQFLNIEKYRNTANIYAIKNISTLSQHHLRALEDVQVLASEDWKDRILKKRNGQEEEDFTDITSKYVFLYKLFCSVLNFCYLLRFRSWKLVF